MMRGWRPPDLRRRARSCRCFDRDREAEDIAEARFSRDAAEALVGEVSARLSRCSVRAPLAGIVLGTKVTLGQFISAAAPQTLLELIDNDRRGVRADVDERDVSRICLKQNAVVTAESFPGAQVDVVTEGISETLMAAPSQSAKYGKLLSLRPITA